MIKWNEVTWYSRLSAIILFLGVIPILFFYIGVQYASTYKAIDNSSDLSTSNAVTISSTTNAALASSSACGLLFSNNLSSSPALPFSCTMNIGHGVTAIFQVDTSGTVQIIHDGKILLTLSGDETESDSDDDNTNAWILNYDNTFGQRSLLFDDINYDGYMDIGVRTLDSGESNIHYLFYIYNPQKDDYESITSALFSDVTPLLVFPYLTNPTIDTANKTISETDFGDPDDITYITYTYSFESGIYVLTDEESKEGDPCTGLTHTIKALQNGKMVITKTENLGTDPEVCTNNQ